MKILQLTVIPFMLIFAIACKQQTQQQVVLQPSPSPSPSNNFNPLAVPSPIIGKPYPGKGVVKLINKKEGWIEIDHEPIEGLMPAMIMEWHTEPRSLLNRVKAGDRVQFTVVETGKAQILTSLDKIKE